MKKGKIIALEGLPGSGKTIIGQYLSKKYKNFEFVEQIINNKLKIKNQYYYLRSDTLKYAKARKYTDKGFNVLLDRSHLSTLAFNYIRDSLYNFRSYKRAKDVTDRTIKKYGSPDFYIYIVTPIELDFLRKRRKFSNNVRDLWHNKESFDDFVRKMERIIKKIVNKK